MLAHGHFSMTFKMLQTLLDNELEFLYSSDRALVGTNDAIRFIGMLSDC